MLRVVKVLSFLKPLKVICNVVVRTLTDLMSIMLLLFIFLFIFTIIGMQLFGGVLGLPETLADGSVYAARHNWNTFTVGFFTTFQVSGSARIYLLCGVVSSRIAFDYRIDYRI